MLLVIMLGAMLMVTQCTISTGNSHNMSDSEEESIAGVTVSVRISTRFHV